MHALLTVQELATELRLAESTFYTWRRRGLGPKSFKLGRRVVYRLSDVEAWLEAQELATSRGG